MSIETVVVAVGTADEPQTERLPPGAIATPEGSNAEGGGTHVFSDEEFEAVRSRLGVDRASEGSTPTAVAERHTSTRALSKALTEAGVSHTIRGAVGDRADGVVEAAEEIGADRVVVGGRGRSPTGKAVFGSVAQEVLLSSPCPVTFVREVAA